MLTRERGYLHWRPDEDGPSAARHLQDQGWVLLPGVFNADTVGELTDDIERVYRERPPDHRRPGPTRSEIEQFRYEMLNRSPVCHRVIAEPAILEVIEPLLGEDCHVIANSAWRNPPGIEHTHGGGRWHIDAGPHVPRPDEVVWDDRIPYPVFVVAAHIVLQDCPVACGPTGVIPRSHTSGRPPPADRLDDPSLTWNGNQPVVLAAEAGDVQLFVSDAWHRRMPTGPGDRGRLFLQVHYGRRDIAQRLKPTSEVNHLSPDAIERLGDERSRTVVGLHRPFFYDG